ncbi:Phosphorelay intermediate protein [Sorochytrium milnesiophthora]
MDLSGLPADVIDTAIFGQLVEMDDEARFSEGLIQNFFEQAETSLRDMDKALAANDLDQLSRLGHFLKGSSAALGLVKLKSAFEKVQYLGGSKDETGTEPISATDAIQRIATQMDNVKKGLAEAQSVFKSLYGWP